MVQVSILTFGSGQRSKIQKRGAESGGTLQVHLRVGERSLRFFSKKSFLNVTNPFMHLNFKMGMWLRSQLKKKEEEEEALGAQKVQLRLG